jgi:hypothetical protein
VLVAVFVQKAIQFLFGHPAHLDQELPDSVLPQLVDADDGCVAFPLGAENGVFQGKIGLLEEPDLGAHKNDMMAEKKIKNTADDTPNDDGSKSAVHKLIRNLERLSCPYLQG